jgi:hypothetical protein
MSGGKEGVQNVITAIDSYDGPKALIMVLVTEGGCCSIIDMGKTNLQMACACLVHTEHALRKARNATFDKMDEGDRP